MSNNATAKAIHRHGRDTEQPADALKETTYVVGNLIYRFLDRLDAGFEYYWGERKNKDNQTGRAKRLMFSVKYPF